VIISSSHEDQFDAKILNEIALFKESFTQEESFTQIKTIKKTSILSATSKKKAAKSRIRTRKNLSKNC
jgi:hypothetical protein